MNEGLYAGGNREIDMTSHIIDWQSRKCSSTVLEIGLVYQKQPSNQLFYILQENWKLGLTISTQALRLESSAAAELPSQKK